jgi:ISXO2-like transposase domain
MRPRCDSGHPGTGTAGLISIFMRGMVGTFHKVSAKYLPLYIAEFQFRYNNRSNADIFGEAISGC